MKKKEIVLLVTASIVIAFLTGGVVSTAITSKQNRKIWLRLLPLIENLDSAQNSIL